MVISLWQRCLRREPDVRFINVDGNDITSYLQTICQLGRPAIRPPSPPDVAEIQTRGSFRGGLT